jgi:hypothetical protein
VLAQVGTAVRSTDQPNVARASLIAVLNRPEPQSTWQLGWGDASGIAQAGTVTVMVSRHAARDLAMRTLAVALPRRWRHVQAVAAQAERL